MSNIYLALAILIVVMILFSCGNPVVYFLGGAVVGAALITSDIMTNATLIYGGTESDQTVDYLTDNFEDTIGGEVYSVGGFDGNLLTLYSYTGGKAGVQVVDVKDVSENKELKELFEQKLKSEEARKHFLEYHPEAKIMCLTDGKKCVSMLRFFEMPDKYKKNLDYKSNAIYVNSIYTDEASRNKGHAKKLLKELIAEAKKLSVDSLVVEVRKKTEVPNKLLTSAGFKVLKETTWGKRKTPVNVYEYKF